MANSEIMSNWVGMFIPRLEERQMLICDSFRGHLTEEFSDACRDNNLVRAVIPGGLTKYCQPLDLAVNKSFKAKVKQLYRRVVLEEMTEGQTQTAFKIDLFTRLVRQAWEEVSGDTIRTGFRKMRDTGRGGLA